MASSYSDSKGQGSSKATRRAPQPTKRASLKGGTVSGSSIKDNKGQGNGVHTRSI